MTLFIDSDIILDLILARECYQESAQLFSLIESGELTGCTTPLVFANTGTDFEDALQYAAAEDAGVDALITRNTRDYQNSSLPIYTAKEILRLI